MSEATKHAPSSTEAKDKKEVKKEELVRAERGKVACNPIFRRPHFNCDFWPWLAGYRRWSK